MNLLILTGLFPPDTGGPATYVPRIASALQNRTFSVEVITSGLESSAKQFNFPVHRVPRRFLKRIIYSCPTIRNRLSWADRVFVNGLELDHTLASLFRHNQTVQKIVGDRSWERHTNQGGTINLKEFQKKSHRPKVKLERFLQKYQAAQSEKIIVPSQYIKTIISNWGIDTKKITVIHNACHPPDSIPQNPINWPNPKLKILTVGRLIPLKRVPTLIDEISNIDRAGLIVLGDGPERERCQELIERNHLHDQVTLKGNVPRSHVWQHMQQADVFVLNSIHETFPHVLLEAMACGTPVLAPNTGGIPEIKAYFPDEIRLFPVGETERISQLIRESGWPELESPPDFPEPLRWEYILERTSEVLRDPREQYN